MTAVTERPPMESSYALGYPRGPDIHGEFYPGMYCPSGFDVMKALVYIASRPNPLVHLGPVDASCAFVVCDLFLPDAPIVYVSDPFLQMTGYAKEEVIGVNCRFLHHPPRPSPSSTMAASPPPVTTPASVKRFIRQAIECNIETQVQVVNYRKDGSGFYNLLSLIPIPWDGNSLTTGSGSSNNNSNNMGTPPRPGQGGINTAAAAAAAVVTTNTDACNQPIYRYSVGLQSYLGEVH